MSETDAKTQTDTTTTVAVSHTPSTKASSGYTKLGEIGGVLLGIILIVVFALKWVKGRQRVEEETQLQESSSQQEKLLVEEEEKKIVSPGKPVYLAVSVRVKDVKKNDTVIAWFRHASSYWIGEERAWKKLLSNLEKMGLEKQRFIFFNDIALQEDNVDVIIAFRAIWPDNKARVDTFLTVIDIIKEADPHPNEVTYYLYPRKVNLLGKEFGFRKG